VADALHRLRGAEPVGPLHAAESAFRKLTFDLARSDEIFGEPEVILSADDPEALERVDHLSEAVRRRRRVRFDYHSLTRDAHARRHVEPWGLLFKYNRWYLIAHDLDRDARRTFRVSRMGQLEVEAGDAAFAEPDLDLSEWTRARAWSLPGQESEEMEVDVRFSFPRSLWADRNGHGSLVSSLEDGAAVRRFRVRSVDPFLRWLLSFGLEVEVAAPAALAEHLAGLRARVAQLHSGTPDASPGQGGAEGGGR
jgi:predicted DNA-binding transcriptional regulator YafY